MQDNIRRAMRNVWRIVITLGMTVPHPVRSHSDAPHKDKAQRAVIATGERAFGREGDPRKVSRTLKIDMADTMRYSPAHVSVRHGETIRFEVRNTCKVMHEIVFGTKKELDEHAALMKAHPGMEQDEPYMAHVAAGQDGRRRMAVQQAGRILLWLPRARPFRSRNDREGDRQVSHSTFRKRLDDPHDRCYCARMSSSLISAASTSVSARMRVASSAGVLVKGFTPARSNCA